MGKALFKRTVSLLLAACMLLSLAVHADFGPARAAEPESTVLSSMDFAVKDGNAFARGTGGLYKPKVDNEILFWGSNQVSALNQTVAFSGTLYSPGENYDKTQLMISLRAQSLGNPWDGADTGYWIYIANTSVIVLYNNATIFQTDDDRYASEPGYSDTRWMLASVVDWCETDASGAVSTGNCKTFYNRTHDYEFSAITEEGGVRLTAKIDGTTILNWLDTESRVPTAGGFSIRTDDVYTLNASRLCFTGDDGQTINMLSPENIGKLSTNTTGFGGYATASQWTMPLMNGGMGEIYSLAEMTDTTLEMDIRVDNPFAAETWILNFFLRDPTPNAFPWDNASQFYQFQMYKDRIEIYQKLASGTNLVDTLYFGIGQGQEWAYWSTPRHLKLSAVTTPEGNVVFQAYVDNHDAPMTTAGGAGQVVDNSPNKILTAGGVGIWGNNNIDKNGETGAYSYCYNVYVTNLSVVGQKPVPETPNRDVPMVDLLAGSYMLDYYFGSRYDAESNAIVIGPHGNTGTVAYSEQPIRDQYIDITLSNTGIDGWHNMLYLRDQYPGYAAWEKGNLGMDATATFYNLIFSGENQISLQAYVGGTPTELASGTLEGVTFADQMPVTLHIECADNDAGEAVLRVFDSRDNLLFKYVDTAKLVPQAGGFTLVSDTAAGKNTTITALKANVAYRDPTILETPIDPNEAQADAALYDLIAQRQILDTKFGVTGTEDAISFTGAPAGSGDIARISADFQAAQGDPQVLEFNLRLDTLQTPDGAGSDWYAMLILSDHLPGFASWDAERAEGKGGYLFQVKPGGIEAARLVSNTAQEPLLTYPVEDSFWDGSHTLRFETYEEADYLLIKVFIDGKYTFRVVDTADTRILGGQGFTFLSKVSSTLCALKGNTVYKQAVPYPEFDPSEKITEAEGMVDLVKGPQCMGTKFDVAASSGKITMGGSIEGSGDIPRFFGNFLPDGAPQVVEMRLKLDSFKTNDGVDADWYAMLILSDALPGFASWEAERTDGKGGYRFHMLADTIAVSRMSAANQETGITEFRLPEGFWSQEHTLRFETYENDDYVLIKVFVDGAYTYRMVDDSPERLHTGGGYTFLAKVHATLTALSANVPYTAPETMTPVTGMQNLVQESQILTPQFDVDLLPGGIVMGGAPNSTSGEMSRVSARFLPNANPQVLKMNLRFNSMYLPDGGKCDWLMGIVLADRLPGFASWDAERTDGNGGYWLQLQPDSISVIRLNSTSAQTQVGAYGLAGDFWGRAHDFTFETHESAAATVIKVFIDGEFAFKVEDTSPGRIRGGVGFTVVSKAKATISAMSANCTYVAPTPAFDLSACTQVDFSELLEDTHDWVGGIRSNNTGKTLFHPNGIELLEGMDKNAGFARKDTSYENFYLDFQVDARVTDTFIQRNIADWVYMLTFRDSDPSRNTWDLTYKNAYVCLVLYDPAAGSSTLLLRRINNTPSGAGEATLASVSGLDVIGRENTWRIGTLTRPEGVQITIWIDGEQVVNLIDKDPGAVRTAGSFMVCQHGTVVNTAIPIVKTVLVKGLLPGEDRPVYTLGVDEPGGEGTVDLYPQDTYEKPDTGTQTPPTEPEAPTEPASPRKTVAPVALLAASAVCIAAILVGIVIAVVKKNRRKKS